MERLPVGVVRVERVTRVLKDMVLSSTGIYICGRTI